MRPFWIDIRARGRLVCVLCRSGVCANCEDPRSSIRKPEDLKNKKVGGDRYGSLSDLILREALRYYNLVPDRDVAVIQTGGLPERLGVLKAGVVDGAIVTGDTALEAEKLGFHKLIDLSQLPIRYPSSTIIVSKSFLAAKRDTVKRFLRGWIEGIRVARSDKETTVSIMEKFLKSSDHSVLERIFEIYKSVHERVPRPDPRLMAVALKQLAARVPQTTPLKIEEFTDQRLINELESEDLLPKSTKPADGLDLQRESLLLSGKISPGGRNDSNAKFILSDFALLLPLSGAVDGIRPI